jgi:hypothetical protein
MGSKRLRQPAGDPAHEVGRAPVKPIDPLREIQRFLNLPDLIMPVGWQDARRVANSRLSEAASFRFRGTGLSRLTGVPRLSRSRAISRSCCCRHALPNSTARKMFGSSCVRIGCQTGSSNPSTISSTTAATPGTRSSISPGRSCPSRAAIGRAWVTQCEDWYKRQLCAKFPNMSNTPTSAERWLAECGTSITRNS